MTVTYETASVMQPFAYGRGYPALKKLPDPAVGTAVTHTVPGSRVYRLLSARYRLATSAVVANRAPQLVVVDGDGIEWLRSTAGAAEVASSTDVFQWFVGMGDFYSATGGGSQMPLPDLLIPTGHQIRLTAVALDPGDQISQARLFVEEFPIGGQGYQVGVVPALPAYPE